MNEYIKFWLAKELIPFVVLLGIVSLFGGFVGLAWIGDRLQKWFSRKRKAKP